MATVWISASPRLRFVIFVTIAPGRPSSGAPSLTKIIAPGFKLSARTIAFCVGVPPPNRRGMAEIKFFAPAKVTLFTCVIRPLGG